MAFPLSIVLSVQPTAFSALAFKGGLAENIAKIGEMGYDGVELAVRDPRSVSVSQLLDLLKNNHLVVPAIGTGQAFGEDGLSFTDPDETVRKRAVERVRSHIRLAAQLNALVIIGLIRGQNSKRIGKIVAEDWLMESLRECSRENPEVRMAIEPINRYETNLINDVSAALDFLHRFNLENVGLLLDTFHMNIEEPSIERSILQARDRIFHMHLADSNRWHPGAGHIPFAAVVETLHKINYSGFLSAEILPFPDPDTAARNTIEVMRGLV